MPLSQTFDYKGRFVMWPRKISKLYTYLCVCKHTYLYICRYIHTHTCSVNAEWPNYNFEVNHSICYLSLHFYRPIVFASFALFIFLSDAPWLFYQDAEYLFHTHASEWSSFEFVCGWLHSDLLTIHSAHEQEFILSKIKMVLEYN